MKRMIKRIYQSNTSGPFVIENDLGKIDGRNKVDIRFINTGYTNAVTKDNAINGRVKDNSINYISDDYNINRFIDYENHINNLLKTIYAHMIDRCYNKSIQKYKSYGELGITVCDRWLNSRDLFILDVKQIYGYEKFYYKPYNYQLDKDYLQLNIPKCNRVYSPETCVFLSNIDNCNIKCIDNNINNTYYGVEENSAGNFSARIRINNKRIYIGTFDCIEAAANAYNYVHEYFHTYELVPLHNNVELMSVDECINHSIGNIHILDII